MAELGDYHDHEDEDNDVANPYTKESNNYEEEGRGMAEIPLCIYCAIACRDNNDTPQEKAFQRIDLANRPPALEVAAASAVTNQTQLGGDSSMDMPPLSPISALDEGNGGEAKGMGVMDSMLPGDTIARLHVRRSRQDPRFAELEGVVPFDSTTAVQISIDLDHHHPFHTHTHTRTRTQACSSTTRHPPPPSPARRRPLPWLLRSRNQEGEEKEREKALEQQQEERPASVLDAHFLPCYIKRPGSSHVGGEIITDEMFDSNDEADIVLGVNVHVHRLTDSVGGGRDFRVRRKPAQGPRELRFDPEPEPADIEQPDRRATLEEFRLPPPPVEQVPATTETDDAARQPTSRLAEESSDSSITDTETSIPADANTNTKAGPNHDTASPGKKPEGGKGKSVVWDPTVARGEETEESDGSDNDNTNPESEGESSSSHESYERGNEQLATDYYYYQPPSSKPPPRGDPRKREGLISPPPTPAQSEEYLELYTAAAATTDKKDHQRDKNDGDEARLASLAMPGRWRGRSIGRGRKGVVCSRCGHRE
ncbi:hypothetical protein FHL15_007984 [Xylaria flabelliformis]|uniref:Uncharacterized protein n=1 Tax=Xylaria flabelliformis TaxID=2512241 RepID=A0A553HTB8_9PEZI|nr:hypothetical protein FHL15_007984 [Xylaria flabelliformis]